MVSFIECNLLGPDLVTQPETHTDLNICPELDEVQRKSISTSVAFVPLTENLFVRTWRTLMYPCSLTSSFTSV